MEKKREFYSLNKKYFVELDSRKKEYLKFLKEEQDLSNITLDSYKNQLYKIRSMETVVSKNRNIENFTVDEITTVLELMQPSSKESCGAYRNRILDYLKFCVVKGYINSNILVIEDIMQKDFVENIISKTKQYLKYVTEEQLYEEVEKLVNPSDRLLMLLPFELVKGTDLEDIVSLRKEDYDREKKTLTYVEHDTGEVKKLKCNDFLADTIEKTIDAEVYYNLNGESKSRNSESEIIKTIYLFEPTKLALSKMPEKAPDQTHEKMLASNIQRRFLYSSKKYLALNSQHVTLKSAYQSGFINKAVKHSIKNYGGEKMNKSDFSDFLSQEIGLTKEGSYRYYNIYFKMFEKFKNDVLFLE
ncbi:uncharacterized protein CBO05P1_275 [Clostridium botulinum B str. Osaka05]|uniref:MrpR N-terminal core-binding domain-containing protein n=1 Tax=Clostridium botulinum B str. Osaka05 TaxID=1407017 RepID=A0A060N9N1_CLOBO|nr:hypothetical protein [Clostridium botulinum]BAO04994.1 uncharacterized protein CBO05P1_275 [Clostridium botulinum B str. Osaka05]